MIGRNIVGYGGASPPWPRISLRNPARESASGQATKTALPHSIAPRPAANGTDTEPVGTLTALPTESERNRPEEVMIRARRRRDRAAARRLIANRKGYGNGFRATNAGTVSEENQEAVRKANGGDNRI